MLHPATNAIPGLATHASPAGLLTTGLIPSVRHALDGLLTSDAILLPASATVYMQAVRLGQIAFN